MQTRDWKPFAMKELSNRNVALHSDGAAAYHLKVPGMLHDHVVHCEKKKKDANGRFIKKDGKFVWTKPQYVKLFKHKLPNGKTLMCKGGTQIIDRVWLDLRAHLKARSGKVGSAALRRRVRSAQWEYWYRGENLWLKTGEMLKSLSSC
jgi:hypothetical protein